MPPCEDCRRPLESYENILCRFCQARLFEWAYWPKVRVLFERIWLMVWAADTMPQSMAWHGFTVTTFEVMACIKSTQPWPTSLAGRVTRENEVWRAYFDGVQQYETHANRGTSALEFYMLLIRAIAMRRHYRRYLLQRFHFDVRRNVRRGPKRPGTYTSYDLMLCTEGVALFNLYEGVFLACLRAVSEAQEERKDLLTTLREAVTAMRHTLFKSMAEFIARMLASSVPWMQAEAMIKLAGYMRPHIRMYPSVRRALGEEGEPRTVLLERLAEYILQAHHAGAREPSELLESVKRLVNQIRRLQHKRSLNNAPEPILEGLEAQRTSKQHVPSELEEWHIRQEAIAHLDALIPHAGLSPREAEVLSLQRAGLPYTAIASQLGITKGSVKKFTNRIKKKLRLAANP